MMRMIRTFRSLTNWKMNFRKEMANPYVHKLNGKLLFRDKSYDEAGRELRRATAPTYRSVPL